MAISNRPKTKSLTRPEWYDDLATDAQHAKMKKMVRSYCGYASHTTMQAACKNALGEEDFCLNTLTKEQIGKVFKYLEDNT